jgi:hypothetical protein
MSSVTGKNYILPIPPTLFWDFISGHIVSMKLPVHWEVKVGDKITWTYGESSGTAEIVTHSDDPVRYRRTFSVRKFVPKDDDPTSFFGKD